MASPAYQRVHSVIRKRIESRQLRIGDAVGSERDLAKIRQVSLMTARHALATLEREGIVERRRAWHTQVDLLNQGKTVAYVLGFYRSDSHKAPDPAIRVDSLRFRRAMRNARFSKAKRCCWY